MRARQGWRNLIVTSFEVKQIQALRDHQQRIRAATCVATQERAIDNGNRAVAAYRASFTGGVAFTPRSPEDVANEKRIENELLELVRAVERESKRRAGFRPK